MGERGGTGGAWGARDEASWWPGGSELQHQQQMNEEIARSTAAATHQLYTYKMTGGFSNNSGDISTPSFDYRLMTNSNTREESPQQPWWYASGSVESQQASSPQNQSSPDPDQSNQQSNGIQQQEQNQAIQQQSQLQQQQQTLQQALQQQSQSLQQTLQQQQQSQQQTLQQNQQQTLQQSQQQTLQQMLQEQQQQQQEQSNIQQNLQQIHVSQAQANALAQAQAVLQQQVVQSFQQQQQNLHEHLQAVQQQQIQAALQRQSATLQELQQQAQQQAQQHNLNQPSKARMPRSKPYNKPRGRMTAYAFFVQTCREEHKKKHPDENVIFAAFSKKCAERWNTMLKKEKQRFHEMAEQDKQRYDLEMQHYVPPKDVKVRGRKRHHVKDPNAPKRSLSAFFWFCNDERSKVKANNPAYTMGDIAKELGRRWAAADPETKTKYELLSEQDKARYDREMTAYKRNLEQQQQQVVAHDEIEEYEVEEEYKC